MNTSTDTTTTTAPAYVIPWTMHEGTTCPLPGDCPCLVDLGDAHTSLGWADEFAWHACTESEGRGRVLRYAPLAPVEFAPTGA